MEKRILLVLGASSDIGMELILKAYDAYDIVLAHYCHDCSMLQKLQFNLGNKLQLIQADFSDENSTQAMIQNIIERYEGISHIVHLPAPKVKNIKLKNSSWLTFQQGYDIQVRSIYMILKALLPFMESKKHGKIVFLISACTINDPPKYWTDYVTVKYALLGFMKAVAIEYAGKNINVNAISPSMIETKFLENIPRLIIEKNAENSPMKRNAAVSDIEPMIQFLLSDEADYITGQNIAISGGIR